MKLFALATSASMAAYTTISTAAATGITVMANEGDGGLFSGITSFFRNMNGGLKALGLAIAVVCAIILGICLMGGGGNAIQKHKGWAIAIAAGVMVVCLAPTLISAISGAFGEGGGGK